MHLAVHVALGRDSLAASPLGLPMSIARTPMQYDGGVYCGVGRIPSTFPSCGKGNFVEVLFCGKELFECSLRAFPGEGNESFSQLDFALLLEADIERDSRVSA